MAKATKTAAPPESAQGGPASQDAQQKPSTPQTPQKQVQAVEFPVANGRLETAAKPATGKLDMLLDMDVPVTVALGHTQIPVRRLLQLGPGSVLTLDRPVDAPVDLYLKDSKFAEADVVVVDNKFALRIRQLIEAVAVSEVKQQ